jgi:hypothetical protein
MLFKPATLGRQLLLVLSGIAKAGALVCSSVEQTTIGRARRGMTMMKITISRKLGWSRWSPGVASPLI